MNDLDDINELKRIAPTLFGLPKSDPFVVSETFFERFPHEVQAKVTAQRNAFPVWNLWKRVAIALPVVALIAGGLWWMKRAPFVPPIAQVEVTPLTNDEIDQVEDNDLLASIDVSPTADLGEVNVQLNDAELLAYLNNEQTDITQLITEEE